MIQFLNVLGSLDLVCGFKESDTFILHEDF